jgi:hypothetical protein
MKAANIEIYMRNKDHSFYGGTCILRYVSNGTIMNQSFYSNEGRYPSVTCRFESDVYQSV